MTAEDPERTMAQREILRLVERATEALPEIFRTVFVTRVIEGMSVQETAELLDIEPETVKRGCIARGTCCGTSLRARSGRCCSTLFRSPAGAARA